MELVTTPQLQQRTHPDYQPILRPPNHLRRWGLETPTGPTTMKQPTLQHQRPQNTQTCPDISSPSDLQQPEIHPGQPPPFFRSPFSFAFLTRYLSFASSEHPFYHTLHRIWSRSPYSPGLPLPASSSYTNPATELELTPVDLLADRRTYSARAS